MSLKVEVIKRAARDLYIGSLADKESSLVYFQSNNFVNDCKSKAIDHLRVREQVREATGAQNIQQAGTGIGYQQIGNDNTIT